ncbi:hypothetical protein CEXT_46781 [Caerostris extrusa]|uniref:Uncharacterized protein n=1 Tax=Caerostris extrusa TaxID=172846 RepID=A0AAV4VNS0_CAEEX|nr:hypothetical protein CEXT_46781 [Caerostris extrusa]
MTLQLLIAGSSPSPLKSAEIMQTASFPRRSCCRDFCFSNNGSLRGAVPALSGNICNFPSAYIHLRSEGALLFRWKENLEMEVTFSMPTVFWDFST